MSLDRGGMAKPVSAQPGMAGLFKDLTAQILAALREGVVPWRRPWRSLMPTRYTGLPFTGTNSLVLSLAADARGYANPFWLTRAQGRRCGAKVLEGEEGTRVLRPLPFSFPDRGKGARHRPSVPLMAPYQVFNGEQFDRLPPRFRVDEGRSAPGSMDRIDGAEAFFGAVGATIVPGGDSAAYHRAEDVIRMPIFSSFDDPVRYYSTLAHEAIHWTGHSSRMRREFGVRFGDPAYAFEEIVAELGASFVMGRLGLPCRVERDHAPYVGHWIAALENDERAIHRAASHAQRAADYLLIATVSGRVRELGDRPLGDRDWIVVYLDIVEVGPHPLVGAVGVDAQGAKRVLGLRWAGTDPDNWSTTAKKLLRAIVGRGICPDWRYLFVTDGSAQLRDAAIAVFGRDTYVQACRPHREREVLSPVHVKEKRDKAREALREAWGGRGGGRTAAVRPAGGTTRPGWMERGGEPAPRRSERPLHSGPVRTASQAGQQSRHHGRDRLREFGAAAPDLRRAELGRPRGGTQMGGRIVPRNGAGVHEDTRPPAPSAPQGPLGPDRDTVRAVVSARHTVAFRSIPCVLTYGSTVVVRPCQGC